MCGTSKGIVVLGFVVLLGFHFVLVFGVFRAFKYGCGRQRLWDLVPIILTVGGEIVVPFIAKDV